MLKIVTIHHIGDCIIFLIGHNKRVVTKHKGYKTMRRELLENETNFKTITKCFNTEDEVLNFQNKLYNKYFNVRIIQCPLFGFNGVYVFKVSN